MTQSPTGRHLGTRDFAVAGAGVLALVVGGPLVAATRPTTSSAVIWAVVFYAVVQVVLLWESGRPGRAPWARIDTVMSAAALVGVLLIMSQLLWSISGSSILGAAIASVLAGGALAGFIATRRRHHSR
ncbi:hypothetical protein V3G39_02090 [Dermatophilaceae bacterium Sec6.4]|nr:hypothetical protein [Actinomycetota bacterium]